MSLTKVDSQLLNGAITTDSSGNVGIGTASPTQKLQVHGTIATAVNSSGAFQTTYNTANTSSRSWRIRNDWNAYGDLAFVQSTTQTGTSFDAKLTIDPSGNLLVGAATEGGNGGLTVKPNFSNGAAQLRFGRASTTNTSFAAFFENGGSASGYISYNNTSTSYVTSSDYRLKENIAPMTGALNTVAQLKPVTYSWKVDGSNGQGFIAHELQAVVPDCVTGEKDAVDAEGNPIHQGIDTSFLVATLTAAIQELKAKVDAQALEIQALKELGNG